MPRNILITGANGQIGQNLLESLANEKAVGRIIATDLRSFASQSPDVFEILDVLDIARMANIIEHYKITEVYHLAAILSASGEKTPRLAWQVNMKGLLNVLEVAKAFKTKVFWPSSIAIFGNSTPKHSTPQNTITEPSTVYGICKLSGELWCEYYYANYGVDIRSVRFPGVISWKGKPGGGTTDYAVEIFHHAVKNKPYSCFLKPDTFLPMIYMDDALAGIVQIMNASSDSITVRTSYNMAGFSFSPQQLVAEIKKHFPAFSTTFNPDFRQRIADSWPASMDDLQAQKDWNWKPHFTIETMVEDMIQHLSLQLLDV